MRTGQGKYCVFFKSNGVWDAEASSCHTSKTAANRAIQRNFRLARKFKERLSARICETKCTVVWERRR